MTAPFAEAIEAEVSRVIDGKPEQIRTVLTVLLAGGHVLLEDVPGVGKHSWPAHFAVAIGGSVHRIQFTPDLLPSDITGVSVYDQETKHFVSMRARCSRTSSSATRSMRASPKTQSALLECMEESQVTIDGQTHVLHEALHGDRDAEPLRHGQGSSPARGAARPIHGPARDRLPRPGRRACDGAVEKDGCAHRQPQRRD